MAQAAIESGTLGLIGERRTSHLKVDQFQRKITLSAELSAERRQRLPEIADRYPVHRTLERVNHIDTILES
ncbi:MAG: hypothetical protein CSA70_11150 [Rhodobacterales bacterium]|nr:MAG: hypothetical protein CSA70_11150 [Rhodobacterales bacterium]